MSGRGAEKRNRAMAVRCANLAKEGLTHKEIAALVQKKPEQIKALILKGQRCMHITTSGTP